MRIESMEALCVLANAQKYQIHTQQLAKLYLHDDTQNIWSIFNDPFT